MTAAFAKTFGVYPGAPPEDAGPILEPGMVFELHLNVFVDGIGGAALGQMMEITQTDANPFLGAPLELITLG